MNGATKSVILAYSGGVDTTACIPYLRHEMGCETVIAVTADLGQGAELVEVQKKAYRAGADVAVVMDAKERFAEEYALPALYANATYDRHYALSSALGRPLIARLLVEAAHEYGSTAVAHGCTGKGNDQVRLDMTIGLLDPDLRILAPARVWGFSRAETIAYSEKYGIEPHVSKDKPWAIDVNVLGRNVEAGPIEDLSWETTEEVWDMTSAPHSAPDEPEYVTLEFRSGRPVAVNGCNLELLDLLVELNKLGGQHGIGRVDMIENRVVGIKSRELYEAPALTLLLQAHREIENLVLPADLLNQKTALEATYAKVVYDGFWDGPLRYALDAFMGCTQENVTGAIKLKLFKGSATVVARHVPRSLYVDELVSYGALSTFNQAAAEGFIELLGLANKTWRRAVALS